MATDGFRLSSSLLYGSLGFIAGVAGTGFLLASPFGTALGTYSVITYVAASFGGGSAGSFLGGAVAEDIPGQK